MLVWATQFPLHAGANVDSFFKCCTEWLSKSPHSKWSTVKLELPNDGENRVFEAGGRTAEFGRVKGASGEYAGVRESWIEAHRTEWITEVVLNSSAGLATVTVRLQANALKPGVALPRPKKPYVVNNLLAGIGGGQDGEFQIDSKPIWLDEQSLSLATRIFLGETSNVLPIVYVSAANDEPLVEPSKLARWLGGVGHLVVEPSATFSRALAPHVRYVNPYRGAVSVLFPRAGTPRQFKLIPTRFPDEHAFSSEVMRIVQAGLLGVRPSAKCTWTLMQEEVASSRFRALREHGSKAIEEWESVFEDERKAKDASLAEAQREVARLNAELQRLEAAAGDGEGGLLSAGEEASYFSGELFEAVVYALRVGKSSLLAEGRRRHLIDDLLAANPDTGVSEAMAEEVKKCLSSGEFGKSEKATLEKLGFTISSDGKHHKAKFHGDDRYTFSISKTGSDHRAGKNLASQVVKTLFR